MMATRLTMEKIAQRQQSRLLTFVLPFAVLLTAGLGLYQLGKKSFWLDEGYSIAFASLSWPKLLRFLVDIEPNGALYHLLLKPWLSFGLSEFAVRSLSVIFVTAAVPAVYGLGSRIFGRLAGAAAAVLFGLNAFVIHYAQEARPYPLALLLVVLSSYFLVRSVQSSSTWSWALFAVTTAMAIYTHFFALQVFGAQLVSLLFLMPRNVRLRSLLTSYSAIKSFLKRDDVPIRRLLVSYAVVGVLLLPLALNLVRLLSHGGGRLGFVPRPTLFPSSPKTPSLVGTLQDLSGAGGLMLLIAYLAAAGIGVFYIVKRWRAAGPGSTERQGYALVLLWLVLPVFGSFVFSMIKPIMISRFLIVALPPMVILAAGGIAALRRPWQAGLLALILLILAVRGLVFWYEDYVKEDWRGAVQYVVTNSQSDDGILFVPSRMRSPFQVYVEHFNGESRAPETIDPPEDWEDWESLDGSLEGPAYFLSRYPANRLDRVWVVLSHGDLDDRRQADNALKLQYRLVRVKKYAATPHETRRIGSGIEVRLYELVAQN